jgi:hypothetical protein
MAGIRKCGILLSHKEERNFVICREKNGTGEHHVKVKLAKFRKIKVACFLSYVQDRFNTNASINTHRYISISIYRYRYLYLTRCHVRGLLEETKRRGKEYKRIIENE